MSDQSQIDTNNLQNRLKICIHSESGRNLSIYKGPDNMNRTGRFNQLTDVVVAAVLSGNSADVEHKQQEVRQNSSIPGNERCRSENDNGNSANNAREKRTYRRNRRNRRDNYIGHQQSTSSSSGNSNARYDGQQAANMDNVERLYCPLSDKNKTFLSLNKTCSWKDSSKNLVSHLLSTHPEHFFELSNIVVGPEFHTEFFFTKAFEKVFMVILKYHQDTNKYCIYVLANLPETECSKFRYTVYIICFEKPSHYTFRKNEVKPLCDILKSKCHDGCLEINIDTMKELFEGAASFNVFVHIPKKKEREIKVFESNLTAGSVPNTPSKDQAPSIDEGILRELECPICNDCMVPPIYICQAGHSVCNSCNKKIVTCPICRNTMLNARNYMLEKLTGHVNYPCKNRSIGCLYVSSSEKIRNHERKCLLTEKNCILECAWKGTTLEMIMHLTKDHTVLELDDVHHVVFGSQKKTNIEAVIHDNQVFLFTSSYGFNIPLQFNLQHLGSDSIEYKYELQILDKSGNDLNFILRHLCPLLVVNPDQKNKENSEQKQGFSLPYDLIQPLVSETKELDYKLAISKVVTK